MMMMINSIIMKNIKLKITIDVFYYKIKNRVFREKKYYFTVQM